MTSDEFLALAKILPEPMMLVTSEGEILTLNKPCADLMGIKTKEVTGKWLWDLVTQEPDPVVNYLKNCSRSRQLVLGNFTLKSSNNNSSEYRVKGAVVKPSSTETPALVMLRLESKAVANSEFNVVNEKIKALTKEIHQRQKVEKELAENNKKLQEILDQFQQTQLQLIQTEKMSSLGQLVAGIAHEINNPINFIHGNLSHAHEYLDDILDLLNSYQKHYPEPASSIQAQIEMIELEFIQEDLKKILKSMYLGTDRIKEIVKSLRTFSRLDQAEFKEADIHEGIESSLVILNNQIQRTPSQKPIEIIREYGAIPLIHCYPGQLNQVIMNLLSNAIDGVNESKLEETNNEDKKQSDRIWIRTEICRENWIKISITDNGKGIPEDIRQKIFDPFFTTKPVGKGTGLGLSISYQIITEAHKGSLYCLSELRKYTSFIMEIPINIAISN
jgi:signal transduction histidine kinase